MPINDSAGVGIYLQDKSQRATTAVGFRSAGAIEADRGLCQTPTLIASAADYVKVFGTPSMGKHGRAAMEAYYLAQRGVPQVLTRAKNPELASTDTPFGAMKFTVEDGKLAVNTQMPASAIQTPVDENESVLYFKGEGDYCSADNRNIVLRFSELPTQSAYATEGQTLRLQVFDFEGTSHVDEDTQAELAFNPDVSNLISVAGDFKLDGYLVGQASGSDNGASGAFPVKVTAYVNGRVGTLAEFDYSALFDGSDWGLFDKFSMAAKLANYADGTPVINPEWDIPLDYMPGEGSDADGTYGVYILYSGKGGGRQELNAFGLSVALTVEATLPIAAGTRALAPGFYSFPCGNATVSRSTASSTGYVVKYSIRTNLYLKNRNSYMFMGEQNAYWASYYGTYCKETHDISFSYDDFDANYVTMQADAVLGSSNYIVSKSSESFGSYSVDSSFYDELRYFNGDITANAIGTVSRSYAASQALALLLADNLTRWRCLATPNLGDVMVAGDFTAAITAADESTVGLSNIGVAASTDVFGNLTGRHGNRFIADYSQYAYLTLAGRRTAITMACLVADLLNTHYNEGIEARPPFGYNYGQVSCTGLSQEFSGADRAMLATQYKINPVIQDGGYFIWEECTSQLTETSLSDLHNIISFCWIKYTVYDSMKAFVAEYNDASTVSRGLSVLNKLNATFISKNYIEEGIPSADKNVIGDKVLRFDYAVRFKGVARFVDVHITAYSQTQTLTISIAEEG